MVDISNKPKVFREAIAAGTIKLKRKTVKSIREGKIVKGNPLHAAKIAGILAAKKTSTLIPLCHQLPLTNVKISAEILDETGVQITTIVRTNAQTGVEMEALTATTASLLTIWDMVKQYEKNAEGQYPSTVIENIHVVKKVKEPDPKKVMSSE
jgi:cyclic pyranopterin phosphate synthase